MKKQSRMIATLVVIPFTLSACVSNNGTPMPKTTDGAMLGGLIGGIIGAGRGGNKKNNVIVGAALGAAVGGLIGQELDRQEQALRASMTNDRVKIVNTGSELVVTLPEDITFDTGSAFVRDSLRGDLALLAANINDFPDTTIDVVGHTDNVGAAGFNQKLSTLRAKSVTSILVANGVADSRIRSIGRGEEEPVASNLSEAGRQQNRRVEIIIRPVG